MKYVFGLILTAGLIIGGVLGAGHVIVDYNKRVWRGYGRFTVINIGENVVIESVDPASGLGLRLRLPEEIQIDTLKQRGQWKPKSLAVLADKYGWKWAGDSVADYLGIAYTGVEGHLGPWDRLVWWNLSRKARWSDVDLGETGLVVSKDLPDAQKVLGVNDRWRDKARELFYATDLGSSLLEVRVWNSTSIQGLAGKAAEVLDSAGVRVIQVGEKNSDPGYCEVVTSPEQKENRVVGWVMSVLGCSWRGDPGLDQIADIFIGIGYANRYIFE